MVIFEISFRSISRKIFKLIPIIILNALAIIMVGAIIYINDNTNYYRELSDKSLVKGNDETYLLLLTGNNSVEAESLKNDIEARTSFIPASGYMWNEVEDLKNQQRILWTKSGHISYQQGLGVISQSTRYAKSSFDIYNLKLYKGKTPNEYNLEEGKIYLYLGSSYKDIEIGTSYNVFDDYEAIVTGIFEKDQYIMNIECYQNDISGGVDVLINLNEEIVAFIDYSKYEDESQKKKEYLQREFFTIKNDKNPSDVISKIKEICEKSGNGCIISNVSEIFNKFEKENSRYVGIFKELLVVIILSATFISSCIMILDIQKNQKMYGILSAYGFTRKQINISIVIENVMVIILASLLAIIITIMQDKYFFQNPVFLQMSLYKIIFFTIILVFITSLVPIIYISRLETRKMIQGEII